MTSAYKRLSIALMLLAAVCASVAVTQASTPQPPELPRDYVVDLAGIIRNDRKSELNAYLRVLEQKTTSQVLVLTVDTLDNQSIEDFALTTKEKWKLGQRGKDNGVLVVVAVKDRKYRIEVGYGLEGTLPDSLVGTIGREYFIPYFKQGDYSTGIYAGTAAIIQTIAKHDGVEIAARQAQPAGRGVYAGRPLGMLQKVVFAVLGLVALILFITHPGQCFLLLLATGGGRGGWSGGGGGFGGDGGSFGGGGGGSGGGGGASGGW